MSFKFSEGASTQIIISVPFWLPTALCMHESCIQLYLKYAYTNRYHYFTDTDKVVSLPAPYETTCLDKKLYGMETYTKSACFTDCMERFVISNCSCRAFYMKGKMTAVIAQGRIEIIRK